MGKRRASESTILTTEFGGELEAERLRKLRRRFLWYTATVFVLVAFPLLPRLWEYVQAMRGSLPPREAGSVVTPPAIATFILSLTSSALYLVSFVHVKSNRATPWPLLKITYWLIVVSGSLLLLSTPLKLAEVKSGKGTILVGPVIPAQADMGPGEDTPPQPPRLVDSPAPDLAAESAPEEPPFRVRDRDNTPMMTSGTNLLSIFFTHFLACLFLPWTARESVRPIAPLIALNIGITVGMLLYLSAQGEVPSSAWVFNGIILACSPLVAAPGAALCWWRHSRFREEVGARLVRGRFAEMHRELTDARKIHESLFPRPVSDPNLSLNYVYEPMRQIGGDFLYVQRLVDGRLHVVIMDVTGHGVPAALTVNRLHGELQRIFAENALTSPGGMLRLLNRYVNLTMADHALYVTAMCLRVDPAQGLVEYASAGHPPAYVRGSDGTIHELPATTYLLGAEGDAQFDPAQANHVFAPGDRLAAFTDGAIEARGADGRMLGLAGMRRLLAGTQAGEGENWPLKLLKAVESFRQGPPADDTLVVEIRRTLAVVEPKSREQRSSEAAARAEA